MEPLQGLPTSQGPHKRLVVSVESRDAASLSPF